MREVVEDGVSGMLVTPGDAAALAGALIKLAGSADDRVVMGAAARTLAVERFSMGAIARGTLEVYATLLGRRGTRR